ncbi:hypothetical protein [Roseobacter sp.]|uniref:hypothetical protein n=1 Tax=Roseobacter sp. TaxID=1907202 RepID=UPI00385CAF33
MQGIAVYRRFGDEKRLYACSHPRNGDYLEREEEFEKFSVLSEVDDCDPSGFYTEETLSALLNDLRVTILEAAKSDDVEILEHLEEILNMCKWCMNNIDYYALIISPYEIVSACDRSNEFNSIAEIEESTSKKDIS